jgi:hypothetical protein
VVICTVQGNAFISSGIMNIFGSISNLGQSLNNFAYQLQPALIAVKQTAAEVASISITKVTTFDNQAAFLATIQASGSSIVAQMVSISQLLNNLQSQARIHSQQITNATASINQMQQNLIQISDMSHVLVSNLTVPVTGELYYLTSPFAVPNTADTSFPNLVPILGLDPAINKMGEAETFLLAQKEELANTLDAFPSIYSGAFIPIRADLSNKITAVLDQALDGLIAMTSPTNSSSMVYPLTQMVKSINTSLSSLTPTVSTFDDTRYYIQLGICIDLLLVTIIVLLAMGTRNPRPPRHAACSTLLMSSALFVATVVVFLLALVLAEVCSQFNVNDPMSIATMVTGNDNIPKLTKIALKAVDSCSMNDTIFVAVTKSGAGELLGFGENFSFNVSSIVTSAIDGFNLTRMVDEGFNIDQQTMFPPGFTADTITSYLNTSFPTLDFTPVDNLNITISLTEWTAFRSTLIVLRGTITTDFLTYLQPYTVPQKLAALNDYKSRLDQLIALIGTTVDVLAPNTSAQLNQLKSGTTTVKNAIIAGKQAQASLIDSVHTIIDAIGTFLVECKSTILNSRIPLIRELILAFAVTAEANISNLLICSEIANSILGTMNSICVTTVGGIDATWFGFFVLASIGVFLVSVYVAVHRMIVELKKMQVTPAAQGETKALLNKEKPPRIFSTRQAKTSAPSSPESASPDGKSGGKSTADDKKILISGKTKS